MIYTLNYSEDYKSISSFITDGPKFFMNFGDRLYSFNDSNRFRLHDSSVKYNTFTTGSVRQSFIKYCVNENPGVVKVFDNISMPFFSRGGIPTSMTFVAGNTASSTIDEFNIKEGIASAAIPRANTNELFGDRMRGRYLLSSLRYYNSDGAMFAIPYTETTYRYSRQ
jgi:hypothetical protein